MSQLNRGAKSRIMYIENKSAELSGPARIGRVTFSKTGKTIYYRDQAFQSLAGLALKANYFDTNTHQRYWISGPRRDGEDRLYGEATPVKIDDDVREEYWIEIRGLPTRIGARQHEGLGHNAEPNAMRLPTVSTLSGSPGRYTNVTQDALRGGSTSLLSTRVEKYSQRIGRSAAAKNLDVNAIECRSLPSHFALSPVPLPTRAGDPRGACRSNTTPNLPSRAPPVPVIPPATVDVEDRPPVAGAPPDVLSGVVEQSLPAQQRLLELHVSTVGYVQMPST